MELKYLYEFTVLVKAGNYQEAAARLFVSQSALSKHIMSIENELGAELIDRSNRKMKLTELGASFLPYAQQISAIQKQYTTYLLDPIRVQENHLIVGTFAYQPQYGVTDLIAGFESLYPDYHVRIVENSSENLVEQLQDGRLDAVFVREYHDLDISGYNKIEYKEDHMVIVLPRDHPLANESRLSLEQLVNEVFIQIESASRAYRICRDIFQNAGMNPAIIQQVKRIETLMDLVGKGRGISMSYNITALYSGKAAPNTIVVELSPRIPANIVLLYARHKTLSPVLREFINTINNRTRL